MKQQTAMQLMLWYLENEGLENSGAYYKAKHLLELEKEQMVNFANGFYDDCVMEGGSLQQSAEQYYNETYGKQEIEKL